MDKTKITQHQLIVEYVKEFGEIIPAKLNDYNRRFKGEWIGSQADKRCRELRNPIQGKWRNPYGKQMLDSKKEGRFEVFYLADVPDVIAWLKPQPQPVGTIAGPYINQIQKV